MTVERVSSQAPWEQKAGYCRAVKSGNHVYISGTVAVGEDGKVHGPNDPGAQAERCLEIICKALADLGGDPSHIVRTRMFLTDMSLDVQAKVSAAHQAVFKNHPPASTMVGVSALADPNYSVEIEADAVLSK